MARLLIEFLGRLPTNLLCLHLHARALVQCAAGRSDQLPGRFRLSGCHGSRWAPAAM